MRYLILLGIVILGIASSFQNCADGPRSIINRDRDRDLKSTQDRIDEIVASDFCQTDIECKAIAFGVKACGGPRSYLVHSQTANFSELEQLVNVWNDYEREQNVKNGVISTCEFLLEPTNLRCVNSKCLAP
ncbi:MAG: hypothetical protein A4S09_04700 [Proteobacteria bacterium SG_bin7]|nr:MAG: hypothetical protein A4S09_04700 [Proteobacteria bacterium SG_bin7]